MTDTTNTTPDTVTASVAASLAAPAAALRLVESTLDPQHAVWDQTHPAGEPILFRVNRGQTLRIIDQEDNQATDVIFYAADDLAEHTHV